MVLSNCCLYLTWFHTELESFININVFCPFFPPRNIYLGLIAGLRAGCCLLYIVLSVLIMKHFKPGGKEMTDVKNAERSTSKELDTANKREILPGLRTSEESEETYM